MAENKAENMTATQEGLSPIPKKQPVAFITVLSTAFGAALWAGINWVGDKLSKGRSTKSDYVEALIMGGVVGGVMAWTQTRSNNEWIDRLATERKYHEQQKAELSSKLGQIQQTLGR